MFKYSDLRRTVRREENNATQLLRISAVQPRAKRPETTSSRQLLCAIADRRSRSVCPGRLASIPRLGKPKGAHRIRDATRGLRYPWIFSGLATVLLLTGRACYSARGGRLSLRRSSPRTLGVRQIHPKNWHGDAHVWVGHPGVSGSPMSFRFPTEFLQLPWPLGPLAGCTLRLKPELLYVW
jgi:hypothetical protein